MTNPVSITIAPPPSEWLSLLPRAQTTLTALRFRKELGLPENRPILMSGHQAAIWHCGILAKWLAVSHAAAALNAAPAWVVVDQDPEDFTTLRLPVRTAESEIESRTWRLASEEIQQLLEADHPPCTLPLFMPRSVPTPADLASADFALPNIKPAVHRIAAALTSSMIAPNAAAQIIGAVQVLAQKLAPSPHLIFASHLATTDLFAQLLAKITADPAACISSYNAAASARPHARIAPLGALDARYELPLWHIDPGTRTRRRVWSDRLASIPIKELAPRTLFLTALVRFAGCDLFIHGIGGGGPDGQSGYDAITTEWMSNWLGEPLAPTATVTADVLLPLTDQPVPSPAEVARAKWLAHHARHDPAVLADAALAAIKEQSLAAIRATNDRAARASHYRQMHAALDKARTANAQRLETLDTDAVHLAQAAHAGKVLTDRTWAFPLHALETLTALSTQIRGSFTP